MASSVVPLLILFILSYTVSYFWGYLRSPAPRILHKTSRPDEPDQPTRPDLTALQQHVLFWDRDGDNLIYPHDVYTGFREIGFSILFSLTALLIPIFFSYPTRLGHSYFPDPFFRIYVDSIHKAKHGSDTGIYDLKGNFKADAFDEIFMDFDREGKGGIHAWELWRMVGRNRVAADPAGWSFAVMEWCTTWILMQRDGRVWKDDLSQCYEGSLFWRLKREREKGTGLKIGYGVRDFWVDVVKAVRVSDASSPKAK